MAELSAAGRKKLPNSAFAIQEERAYPIDTENRARNALARVSQHGSPAEQRRVHAAVRRRYPGIEVEARPERAAGGGAIFGGRSPLDVLTEVIQRGR